MPSVVIAVFILVYNNITNLHIDLWKKSGQLRAVVSCQLSVVSCQLSVVSCQLSVASCQLPVASCQLPVASCQLPVASCQLPVASWRLAVVRAKRRFVVLSIGVN